MIFDDGADLFEDGRGPGGGDVAARRERDDLADAAGVDRLLGHAVARVEADDVADEQDAPGAPARLDDLLRVGDRGGDGLFEEDVLAGLEGGDGGLGVLVPHGADGDGIDLRIGEHVVVVAVEFFDAEFFAKGGQAVLGAGAQGGELEVGDAGDGFGVDFAEPAEADDADAQFVHVLPQ